MLPVTSCDSYNLRAKKFPSISPDHSASSVERRDKLAYKKQVI